MLSAILDWLPTPEYEFRGGSADGKTITVRMVETERGLTPSRVWHVEDDPVPLPLPGSDRGCDIVVTYHSYRFMPTTHHNVGYYQWIKT